MEGWVDLGYPAVHRPEVELAISRSQVRRPNHYITEQTVTTTTTTTTSIKTLQYLVLESRIKTDVDPGQDVELETETRRRDDDEEVRHLLDKEVVVAQ